MNTNKLIVLLTTVCFLQSSVAAPLIQATSAPLPGAARSAQAAGNLLIPSSMGRITGGAYFGSRKTVINIQDLHCHPGVQRNINRILGALDAHSPLKTVFVEGGYGAIDTAWLDRLSKSGRGQAVVETMLEQGRLTGAEYYAMAGGRPDILRGLEDEQVHKGNIRRLGMMLDNAKRYESVAATLDGDRAFLEAKYFTARNRRFNEKVRQHAAGGIATDKYYSLLEKYVEKINARPDDFNNILPIDMARYPNMRAYREARRLADRLSFTRASRQLQAFIGDTRQKVSYSDYAALLQATDNFKNTDRLYASLAPLAHSAAYAWDRYPDVQTFLRYIEQEQAINPVAMLKEEKRLVEEIRAGLARDISELEVSFAVDFYQYFKDYLFNRLAADDYQYFAERVDQFKRIWTKYTYVDHLAALEPDYALLDEYYRVNTERNQIFLRALIAENRPSEQSVRIDGGMQPADTSIDAVIRSLNHNKDIVVVVSGGFHAEGMEQLLRSRAISYLTITPAITGDTAVSGRVYRQLIGCQAAAISSLSPTPAVTAAAPRAHATENPIRSFVKNLAQLDFKHSDALGATIVSSQNGMEQFQAVAAALMQEAGRNVPIHELVTELTKIDREIGREDAFRADNGNLVAMIDGREIQLPIAAAAEEPAAVSGAAPLSKEVVGRSAEIIKNLAAWVFSQPQAVKELFPALVTATLWLAEHNILVGDGPIPELDRAALSRIADGLKADPSVVARLPAPLQKAQLDIQTSPVLNEFDAPVMQAAMTAIRELGIAHPQPAPAVANISRFADKAPIIAGERETTGDGITTSRVSVIAQGMQEIRIELDKPADKSHPPVAARGSAYIIDPDMAAGSIVVNDNMRTRDLITYPLQDNDPDAGKTIQEWARQESRRIGRRVIAAFNAANGGFVHNNTVVVSNGQLLIKSARGFGVWTDQEGRSKPFQPPHGVFHVFSMDPENIDIIDIELDANGSPTRPLPMLNGFAGRLLLKDGESCVDSIKPRNRQPCMDGDTLGWDGDIANHYLALNAYGYRTSGGKREMVVVQLAGDPDGVTREPTLLDLVSVLQRLGVRDAILGGSSGEVQNCIGEVVLKADDRRGSAIKAALESPEFHGQRRIAAAVVIHSREAASATLPKNVPRYEKRIAAGWPQRLALWEVHLHEFVPLILNWKRFADRHNQDLFERRNVVSGRRMDNRDRNKLLAKIDEVIRKRNDAIRTMAYAGRAAGSAALAAMIWAGPLTIGLGPLADAALRALVPLVAGFIVSGIAHVEYDVPETATPGALLGNVIRSEAKLPRAMALSPALKQQAVPPIVSKATAWVVAYPQAMKNFPALIMPMLWLGIKTDGTGWSDYNERIDTAFGIELNMPHAVLRALQSLADTLKTDDPAHIQEQVDMLADTVLWQVLLSLGTDTAAKQEFLNYFIAELLPRVKTRHVYGEILLQIMGSGLKLPGHVMASAVNMIVAEDSGMALRYALLKHIPVSWLKEHGEARGRLQDAFSGLIEQMQNGGSNFEFLGGRWHPSKTDDYYDSVRRHEMASFVQMLNPGIIEQLDDANTFKDWCTFLRRVDAPNSPEQGTANVNMPDEAARQWLFLNIDSLHKDRRFSFLIDEMTDEEIQGIADVKVFMGAVSMLESDGQSDRLLSASGLIETALRKIADPSIPLEDRYELMKVIPFDRMRSAERLHEWIHVINELFADGMRSYRGTFNPENKWHQIVGFFQAFANSQHQIESDLDYFGTWIGYVQQYPVSSMDAQLDILFADMPEIEKTHIRYLTIEAKVILEEAIIPAMRAAHNNGKPLLIVENMSYGGVALAPVEWLLPVIAEREDVPLRVIKARQGSTEAWDNDHAITPDLFPDAEIAWIAAEQPMVLILDGTKSVEASRRSARPHYPDAYKGYRNFFLWLEYKWRGGNIPAEELKALFARFYIENAMGGTFSMLDEAMNNRPGTNQVLHSDTRYTMGFFTPVYDVAEEAGGPQKKFILPLHGFSILPKGIPENIRFDDVKGPTLVFVQTALRKADIERRQRGGDEPAAQATQRFIEKVIMDNAGQRPPEAAVFDDTDEFEFEVALLTENGPVMVNPATMYAQAYYRQLVNQFEPQLAAANAAYQERQPGEISAATGDPATSDAAILPATRARFVQRLLLGLPERWWTGVHGPEYWRIMGDWRAFDADHGTSNAPRTEAIRQMHRAGWRWGVIGATAAAFTAGLATMTVGIGLLAVPIGFVAASFIASGLVHIRYDKQAGLSLAIFVKDGEAAIPAELTASADHASVVIERLTDGVPREGLRNLGFKAGGAPVWMRTDAQTGATHVYVGQTTDDGAPADFIRASTEVVATLTGRGRIAPNNRVMRSLKVGNNPAAVVFDYTDRGLRSKDESNKDGYALDDVAVVDGAGYARAGFGATLNLISAKAVARRADIAIEKKGTGWLDMVMREDTRFNQSVVMRLDDIGTVGADTMSHLKARGAQVIVRCAAADMEALIAHHAKCHFAGVILTGGRISEENMTALQAISPDVWVAREGDVSTGSRRSYRELDLAQLPLDALKHTIDKRIGPRDVVRVTLGANCSEEKLAALRGLPSSVTLVFSDDDLRQNSRIISRDIITNNLFGVNLFRQLKLTPRSPEERKEQERRIAYHLEFTIRNVDDVAGRMGALADAIRQETIETGQFPEDIREALEAVRLHLMELDDAALKVAFKEAMIGRFRGRVFLAQHGQQATAGLADTELEILVGRYAEGAVFVPDHDMAKKVESMTTEGVYQFVKERSKIDSRDPQAVNALLTLIALYAEPRLKFNARTPASIYDARSARAFLAAA